MAKKQTKVNPETEMTEVTPVETTEATKKLVDGKVTNCTKLNIRKKPELTAEPIAVVDVSTTLAVDIDKSSTDWYKVTLTNGKTGYCMKQYVTLA